MPLIVPVLAALLGLAGCAGLGVDDVYRPPTLNHDRTHLTGLSWDSVQGRSQVTLDNPNAYRLPISGFDVELWLDGEPWLTLDSPELSGLAGDSATRADLDWTLALAALLERSRAAYQAGQVELTLRLAPILDVPLLGPRRLDWRHEFSVPLPRPPQLRLTDWRVASAGLSELTLVLDLAVSNPNRFDLALGPWELAVQDGDQALTRLRLEEQTLAAGASAQRATRLTLGYGALGAAVLDSLAGGRWPADLALTWSGPVRSPELGLSLPDLGGELSP